jgi:integrase
MLAFLLGCGLRRSELIGLKLSHVQKQDDHWAIIDLYGKGGHIRTVPVPAWVKVCLDEWLTCACRQRQARNRARMWLVLSEVSLKRTFRAQRDSFRIAVIRE